VRRAIANVALAATLACAAPSSAYVRARTTKGIAIAWPGSCVFMQPDSDGTPDMSSADAFGAIQRAINNWDTALGGVSYLKLVYQPPTGPLEAHLDGVNVVKFRTDRWCHPEDAQEHNVCYSHAAAGITTVFFVDDGHPNSGAIEDTDIELNDLDFYFVNIDTPGGPLPPAPPGRQIADLENTVTHELGHVMGLDHTCKDMNTPPQEVDETGNPPPLCSVVMQLPPNDPEKIKITTATMYPTYTAGETSKRQPHPDDVAGIVNGYPTGHDPNSCKPTKLSDYATGGCSFDGRAPRPLAAVAILAAVAVALLVRRRRATATRRN
jgi:hypothetical protein